MRIGSLFSGYGGLDLAVQSVLGGEIAWHVEYDKAPSRILDHHFSGVPNYGDVTQLDFTSIEPVDVITGGYPCQPFSHAGLRKGTDDERHLWPHVLRAICEMGPRLAVLENVRGHLSLGFDAVLADLADVGWSAQWGVVRASDAGAPHQRARLFIVAYPSGGSLPRPAEQHDRLCLTRERRGLTPADASSQRHGRGQDAGIVGRVGATPEVIGRQASPARSQSCHRGPAARHDSERLRVESLGLASPSSDTSCGCGEDRTRLNGGRPALVSTVAGAGCGDRPGNPAQGVSVVGGSAWVEWGDYGPAIARWEAVLGRPAPAPTEPGRTGAPRLSPRFVEWMMGLPDGWVTDPAIGISRNDQLKALGNGVVPQQAALALDVLLQGATDDLRQSLATV